MALMMEDDAPARATVLLVDDDDGVRRLARRVLARGGYAVLEARSGAEALDAARAHDGPIHLVMLDVLMPGMTGNQLSHHLLEARPGTPVLVTSGSPDDPAVRFGMVGNGRAFLPKPFSPADLLAAVARMLSDAPVQG